MRQSNPTYPLEAASGPLRVARKPPGSCSHPRAVDRDPRHPLGDFTGTEAVFAVRRRRSHRRCSTSWSTSKAASSGTSTCRTWVWPGGPLYNVNETIARLHSFDYEALGLGDRQAGKRHSRRQYRALDLVKAMDALIATSPWTVEHRARRRASTTWSCTAARILAVLDSRGDRAHSPILTYHLMAWQMPDIGIGTGLLGLNLEELGIPDEDT